ncbi:FG-GAP repeat domain-containing protein [Roseovarius nitratireducens]|uniref:FG-GAP repeat domain-containing protein n=1 Tax=Roseovarius nitratireducens TaxID=2044597 RepID=UPI00101ADBCC|nr:VCBS repeat-containing protein [Roseovarius nitratireducens]
MRGLALIAALLLPGTAAAQAITAANYTDPTDRYGHRVLGAGGEWGALTLNLDDGTTRRVTLPDTLVFEDIAPRLADLDGDGAAEVIVVESSLREGARLAVYGPGGRIAATPHIGRRNRWLAPVGAADLDGDGHVEIAYIDRPHLAQVLRVWRFRDGALTHVADASSLTNHKIGWDFIPGGIRHCGDAPEMITAVSGWSQIAATRLDGGALMSAPIAAYRGPEDLDAALTCP